MSFLLWLESTGFGTFVRESESLFAYPTFIVLHTFGLSIVVGISVVVGTRLMGLAPTIPLAPLNKLFPIMWFGFAINLFSGSGLAAAAASTTIPNPLFIAKIIFVLTAVAVMVVLQVKVFRDPEVDDKPLGTMSKALGGSLLALWLLAMISGRLITYIA
ncbi:MAG: hypothetical protein O7E51_04370 [Acidobacteria bacterium]|nr:hypothetical protein [Acidobacteriota bacterium]